MDVRFRLPPHVTAKLKCDLCQAYLSLAPIGTHEGKVSCGRCDPGWPRNVAYEELAQFMVFPCSYCEESLQWANVERHELKCRQNIMLCPSRYEKNFAVSKMPKTNFGEYHKECQYRRIKCPFDCCDAYYEVKGIWQHFSKFHNDYIFTNVVKARKILKEDKVWNFTPDTQVCLIMSRFMPFVVFVHSGYKCEETTGEIIWYDYYFSVFSLCSQKCDLLYTVNLNLNSGTENANYVMKNQEIVSFNPSLHNVKYLRVGLIQYNSFNFMTTKFEKLKRSRDLILSYNLQIVENFEPIPGIPQEKDTLIVNVDSLSGFLECPICKDYMTPPVYNCNTGHTLCRKCRELLVICPFCQAIIGNSRNFVLEDILETLRIACQNENKGCPFTGTVQEIKLHELICNYNC